MYKKLLNIFVLLMLFGLIFPPAGSFAFKSITRDQLVYDAIEFAPSELRDYLRDNLDSVIAGTHFAELHQRRSYSINPYETESIYNYLIEDLKEGKINEYNTAHAFGVMACFIAETISPDNFRTPQHLIPDDVKYDGFQEIDNVKSNITSLIENYRNPCMHKWDKDLMEDLYNVAVNEIVDYWTSAWEKSGYQTGTSALKGQEISHQNLVLNSKTGK
jgi:hypothetical protein